MLGRVIRTLVVAALISGGVVAATQAPAAAAGCRAAPYSATWTATASPTAHLPSSTGAYTTTSQCSDINMRTTNGLSTFACVIFIVHTTACNYTTLVPGNGSWVNIATNVADGTRFRVKIWHSGSESWVNKGYLDF